MGAWVKGSLNFAITLPGGTSDAEGLTDYVPGFPFLVESVKAYFTVAAAGTSASRVCNVVRTNVSTDYTLATATILLADGDTLGKEKLFTTTPTEFSDTSKLSIMFPTAGAVAFTGGVVNVCIGYRTRVVELVGS
jgi:hypothetical protein